MVGQVRLDMPTSLTDQLYNTEQSNKPLTDQLSQNEQSKKSLTDQLYDTEIDSKKTTEPIVEQSVDYPAFFNPFFVTTPSARPESIRGDENQFPVNIPEKDREMYERQKRINESLATAEEWSKNKAEKINRITYISPYGEKQEKNESLIRKGLSKLNDWFGTDIKTKLSDEVKAQNVVKYMADEAKMPLYEYRQAPLFIEQAAQGYMSAIPFYTDIQKELTGEEPWPAEHPLDKTGHIGGFLFGLFTSLGPVMGQAISPITKYIPAVYDTDPIAKRILHTSLRDSINFGATMGLLSTGDASHKSTFSEAAPVIWDGVKTGVYYANFFAIAKGAFPNDPQVFARTLTGLIGLNAYRVKQLGVSEYTNRPWEDHIIDALTDVAFLFHGLPKSPLETFNKEVSENFKSATEIDQKKSMIETIPDEGIRKAQEEILKNKDIQLSMRIDQMIDKVVANLNSNNEIKIKGQELEVVKVKAARKISKKEVIKPEIVEPKKEVIKLEELKEPEESIKQVNKIIKPSESPELSKSIASELGIIYDGEMEWKPGKPFYSWSDPETGKSFTTLTTNKADVEDKLLNIKIQNNTIEDPIKVDLQTSNMSVDDFSTDNNPLRNTDSVFTSSQKKLYAEKTHIGNNPTILVSKFLNDVNCWLNGDNSIDIEMLKKEFSKYTSSIIDPRNRNSLVEFFGVFSEADNFIESAKDMNSWVSKASRSTKPVELGKVNKSEDSEILEDLVRIKTIEDYYGKKINDISDKELEDFFSKDSDKIDWFGEGDTKDNSIKLNFMIPLDEMPKEVAKFLGDTKGLVSKIVKRIGKIPAEPLFRNEKLFDETGYWLGKDGMWRYELSPDKFRFNVNKLLANKDIEYKMPDIVQYTSSRSQDIYSNIEELNDVKIILSNKFMGSQYDPIKNTIEILLSEDFTNKTIIRDLIHEVKHAINHFTNSPFLGTSMGHFFTPMFTKEASEYIYDLQRSGKISIEKARNFRQLLIDKDFYEAYIELIHSLPNKETKNIIAIKDKLYAKAFAEYWKDQGEMESRLEEKRFEMTKEERIKERPWETLDKMLDMESLDKDTIPTKISKEHGHTLYSGIDINEAVKQIKGIVTEANKFFEEFHKSKKEKKFDLFYAAKQLKIDTVRAFIEQSESLMKKTIDLFGEEGYKVVQRQRAAATGGGYGKFKYEQIVEDVYEGKSNKQIDAINAYILARRFKDIYGYKSEKTYKHQSGYGATESISATSIIEILKDLSPEALGKLSKKMPELTKYLGDLTPDQFKDIIKSGESYFNHIREVVDDLVKEGIKTVEEGEALKAHDFTKFKSLTIESLFDSRYKIRLGNDTIKVTSSGIESLGSGSHNILEMDARATLSEFTGRSYGIIANNEALRAWKGLAEKNPDNIIVSDKHKSGWSPIPFFDGGKRKNLYFHPDVSKYLMNRSHDVSKRFSQICQWSMLSPVTRSLAIGLSPVWSTFAGLPMDVVHTLFSARTYDPIVGKYKAIYNAFDPIYPLRLGVDMKRTLVDVYTRGELFKDYMRYGGSMPFLAMRQSRYMKGTHSPSEWAKLLDLVSYHGRSMELWVRVATADRVIRNRAKELNITHE